MIRRLWWAWFLGTTLLVGACGSTQQAQTTEAYRVALAVARHMCQVVNALPDAPVPTSGGEADAGTP